VNCGLARPKGGYRRLSRAPPPRRRPEPSPRDSLSGNMADKPERNEGFATDLWRNGDTGGLATGPWCKWGKPEREEARVRIIVNQSKSNQFGGIGVTDLTAENGWAQKRRMRQGEGLGGLAGSQQNRRAGSESIRVNAPRGSALEPSRQR